MARMYSVSFTAVAVTVAQDLFEVVPGANNSIVLHSIYVSQSSDFADAQDEMATVLIKSGQTTTGSGGSTPTAIPLDFSDAASASTCKANNTTKATAGTIVTLHADNFNVRAGFQYRPTPEERITIEGSRRLTVELLNAPTDSLTVSGTLYFMEF